MRPVAQVPSGSGSGPSSELEEGMVEVWIISFLPDGRSGLRCSLSDQPTLGPPRKHSVAGLQQPLASPRDSAPPPGRGRNGPGFDGVLGSGETWNVRRRVSETKHRIGGSAARDSGGVSGQADELSEMKLGDGADEVQDSCRADKSPALGRAPVTQSSPQRDDGVVGRAEPGHAQSKSLIDDNSQHLSGVSLATTTTFEATTCTQSQVPNTTGTTDLASIEWSYLDTQGIVQGERLSSLGRPGL